MDRNSLSHTKWNCTYHIVFIRKYRRKVMYGAVRTDIREIIRTLCGYKEVEILEGNFTVKYIHLPELLTDLAISKGAGTYKKVLAGYKKYNLLIFDEWLLTPLSDVEVRDLLEIIEARHLSASTIFISQFAPAGWHQKITETTIADTVLDRIIHNSYEIFIDGRDSMRKKKGMIER